MAKIGRLLPGNYPNQNWTGRSSEERCDSQTGSTHGGWIADGRVFGNYRRKADLNVHSPITSKNEKHLYHRCRSKKHCCDIHGSITKIGCEDADHQKYPSGQPNTDRVELHPRRLDRPIGSFESLWVIVIFQPTHPTILHSYAGSAIGDEIAFPN